MILFVRLFLRTENKIYIKEYRKGYHRLSPERGHMREKTIEQKLAAAVRAKGGIAPKFVSPGFDGMPDRLVLLPDGKSGFVEVKASGRKPRLLQNARIQLLRNLGFLVFVLDEESQIPLILSEIGGVTNGV